MAESTSFTAQTFTDTNSQFNAQNFHILQLISKINTTKIVQVVSFGKVAGTINVQPMVSMMGSDNVPVEHGTVWNIPYFRLQAGLNGIEIEPEIGDIGIMACCDRDISAVKKTGKVSAPPSARMHEYSDGVYFGGLMALNRAPTQYIRFGADGIKIESPIAVNVHAPEIHANADGIATITAPQITLNGTITQNGNVSTNGNTTASGNVSSGGQVTAASNIYAGGDLGAAGGLNAGGFSASGGVATAQALTTQGAGGASVAMTGSGLVLTGTPVSGRNMTIQPDLMKMTYLTGDIATEYAADHINLKSSATVSTMLYSSSVEVRDTATTNGVLMSTSGIGIKGTGTVNGELDVNGVLNHNGVPL